MENKKREIVLTCDVGGSFVVVYYDATEEKPYKIYRNGESIISVDTWDMTLRFIHRYSL